MLLETNLVKSLEVTIRKNPVRSIEIKTPQILKNFLLMNWNDDIGEVERCYILCLDARRRVVFFDEKFKGNAKSVKVEIQKLILHAYASETPYFIVAHNHPDGNFYPSPGDDQFTKELKDKANYFGLNLIDHVIVSEEGFYSYQEEGKL